MLPPRTAQKCLSWIATAEEREDRLGDLEEAFHRTIERNGLAAARRHYVKDAALCSLSILRRRFTRAILHGGQDMLRIFLWAILSVFVILLIFGIAGGEPPLLVQPFEWAIILLTMFGFALGANRLAGWEQILLDLRRADRLNRSGRAAARTAALPRLLTGNAVAGFAHLQTLLDLAKSSPDQADSLIGGSIALTRDQNARQLQIVRATMIDAYIGAGIAFILGFIHICSSWTEPPEVFGHLLGGTACALFSGMILAHAVIGPIAGRLSDLYGEDIREMEAARVSLKGSDFAAPAFDALLEPRFTSSSRTSARLSLILVLPAFVVLLCLITLTPIDRIAAKLGFPPRDPYLGEMFYDLPSASLNLDAPGQPILDFRLSLQFSGSPTKDTIDQHAPQIMDAAQILIRDMKPEDFRGSEKLATMRQVLQGRINQIIKPQQINDVLFKQAVVH